MTRTITYCKGKPTNGVDHATPQRRLWLSRPTLSDCCDVDLPGGLGLKPLAGATPQPPSAPAQTLLRSQATLYYQQIRMMANLRPDELVDHLGPARLACRNLRPIISQDPTQVWPLSTPLMDHYLPLLTTSNHLSPSLHRHQKALMPEFAGMRQKHADVALLPLLIMINHKLITVLDHE